MGQNVFRKDSLEKISSTEELRDYMHVTSPRMWMILVIILLLVVGFIIFACTVTMENAIATTAEVMVDENEGRKIMDITITIPNSAEDVVKRGMPVVVGSEPGKINSVYSYDEFDTAEAVVFLDDSSMILAPGTYDAKIILERISPISFLLR